MGRFGGDKKIDLKKKAFIIHLLLWSPIFVYKTFVAHILLNLYFIYSAFAT